MIRSTTKSLFVLWVCICAIFFTSCKYFKSSPAKYTDTSSKVYSEMENFVFSGKSGERIGIYVYEFGKRQERLLWSSKSESVVDVSHNTQLHRAYFITVNESGEKQSLPFYKKAKIYFVDVADLTISSAIPLDDGLQLYAYWNKNNTVTVLSNEVDQTIATYINQKTWIFNANGEQVFGQQKTFDLTKDGYPQFVMQAMEFTSPNGKDILRISNKNEITLKTAGEGSVLASNSPNANLQQIEWSLDSRYVIFSMAKATTLREKQKKTFSGLSTLYAASSITKRVIFSITGKGYRPFEIINHLMVFTDSNKNIPYIVIYDLEKLQVEKELHIPGGCSIKNVSEQIANNTH